MVARFPKIFGITAGFGILIMAVGRGLAGVVHAEPRLKYVGGAYLLYLAWCIGRADTKSGATARAKPIGLFGAAIGRLLGNPRARLVFNWSMAGLLVISLIPVLW